jgi:hypothetical protein
MDSFSCFDDRCVNILILFVCKTPSLSLPSYLLQYLMTKGDSIPSTLPFPSPEALAWETDLFGQVSCSTPLLLGKSSPALPVFRSHTCS